MKKIPTLFKREYKDHQVIGIYPELSDPSLQLVLDGIAVPTLKEDGSCCAILHGELYKRYDAKKGKKAPAGAIPCQDAPDEITGHWPHWVKCDPDNPADRWFIEAYNRYMKRGVYVDNWTYEAIGKHFQGNPYHMEIDTLYKHGDIILPIKEVSFEYLKSYLKDNKIEGIVFWYHNEPICKIKRSDFGYEWPVEKGGL